MFASLIDLSRGRIRLSIALALVTLLAIGCGAARWWWLGVQEQAESSAHLESRGFAVIYEWELMENNEQSEEKSPYGPEWLRVWLGADAFNRVATVAKWTDRYADPKDVTTLELTTDDVAALNRLAGTEKLELEDVSAPTSIWKGVRLPRLRELSLTYCDIPDEGVAQLSSGGCVEELILTDCSLRLRGNFLAAACQANPLNYVSIEDCDLDEGTFEALAQEPTLKRLNIRDASVNDAVVEYVTRSPNLEKLWLAGPRLTDAALHGVARSTSLKLLFIKGAAITPQGIAGLGSLSQLETLMLYECRVGDAFVPAIVTTLPTLKCLRLGWEVQSRDKDPELKFLSPEAVEELRATGMKVCG